MKYDHFDPDTAEEATPPPSPTKDQILCRIEQDHYEAKEAGNKEAVAVLEERHAAVKSASDEDAWNEYQRLCSMEPEPSDIEDARIRQTKEDLADSTDEDN